MLNNKITINKFFPPDKLLSYTELVEYIDVCYTEYYLREIVSNTFWHIEACINVFKNNKSFTIIFDKDVISPYRGYNHIELQQLVDKLDNKYKEIIKLI